MNNIELATIAKYNLPITIIIINNNSLGLVRQCQTKTFNKRYSETTLNRKTNFVKLAEANCIKGFTVSKKSELKTVLKECLTLNQPTLIDYLIDINEI